MSLFKDSDLLSTLGSHWSLTKFGLVSAAFLMLLALASGAALKRHTRAPSRRLNEAEAADFVFNVTSSDDELHEQVYQGKAVGAEVRMHLDIDGIRAAAKRGDWTLLWLWLVAWVSFGGSLWLVFSVALLHPPSSSTDFGMWIAVSIFMLAFTAMLPVMMWLALFTKFDNRAYPRPPIDSSAQAAESPDGPAK
jgi:hypothetical protein